MNINAAGTHYRDLNHAVRQALADGHTEIVLDNVCGHRYIGTGLTGSAQVTIHGVPGNDLGAFMSGPTLRVMGNAQDGVANTMNAGTIVIHGSAGDILGHSMRGGRVFLRGGLGYRAGIHMKAFEDRLPVVVVGGTVKDYLGEYMAGGLLVVLGLGRDDDEPIAGEYVGTGMHGGEIYLRGQIEPHQMGREVGFGEIGDAEWASLSVHLEAYCREFDMDPGTLTRESLHRLLPLSRRPYGNLYAY